MIPRRSAHKRLSPLCLDASIGGHVSSGETYDEAFARELREEVNIDAAQVVVEKLGALTPHQHAVSAFQQVYKIRVEQAPAYNRDDFIEYYWLSPQQLLERLKTDRAKSDLAIIIQNLF